MGSYKWPISKRQDRQSEVCIIYSSITAAMRSDAAAIQQLHVQPIAGATATTEQIGKCGFKKCFRACAPCPETM
jgi:hypothetical protein